ncbi:heparinase II/III family protein [Paenibacillus hodogayensis]|uniref:Heparinase II/III family protein n=1 Tax=Paenibacillus hodogayensis TaxID=279208 RepID=A0ABV5W2D5_9BACL
MTNRKTRATYYTPGKVSAARDNVRNYAWAAALRDAAVSKAEAFVALGLDFLWEAVPPQTVPRSYGVNQVLGSPITGREIDKFGNYPYMADIIQEPWKILDPSSGLKFPSNDFDAFYRSGLDEGGMFRRERADRSLLVNSLYPDKGPGWGVDDGLGWIDDSGNVYTFVAYYAHWFVWHGRDSLIEGALTACRDAFLYTGDLRYARAGIVLLDRVADVYPELDIAAYDRAIFLNSDGRKNKGKAIGSIWETFLVKIFIQAYDAFFPVMDDAEVVAYLSAKARQCGLSNPKSSGADIRRNVEEGILLQIYPAVKAAQICGNDGMHQSALALAAVVYDTLPETKEWLDFTFRTGGLAYDPYQVTGGNILNSLISNVDRDGHGNEASPGYNGLWLAMHQLTADILDGYDLYPEADLYKNAKLRKMFSAFPPLLLGERYTLNAGDTAATGNPYIQVRLDDMLKAFDRFGDPLFAQVAYRLNGNRTEGLHLDVFTANPEHIAERVGQVIGELGPLQLESTHLSGYGFTALRDGDASRRTLRNLWLYYGRNTGHGHRDTLNIGVHAFGLDLTPDLGYPEFADFFDMHRAQWVINTISHNAVVVDKSKQQGQWVAEPRHFDPTGQVQLIDVEAPKVYPQTELYRRTTAMIRADGDNSYAVDFFRVKGGRDHHFSFHGPEGPATTEGLSLSAQPSGTYAGADVAYGQRADDKDGSDYNGSGFHYLTRVERDGSPPSGFSVDWQACDTWNVFGGGAAVETDVHVRLTMLTDAAEAALADGIPPQNKPGNPQKLRYLIVHRHGEGLDSLFASVIEPYKGSRFVTSITAAAVRRDGVLVTGSEAAAVKVTLKSGRTDYVVSALDPDIAYTVDDRLHFQGCFGVYAEREGTRDFVYVHDGRLFAPLTDSVPHEAAGAVEGTVVDFTRTLTSHNELLVQTAGESFDPAELTGKTVFVENDGQRNAVYRIVGAAALGDGRFRLDIGDSTLIRAFADERDFAKGYLYDIEAGAALRIPLTRFERA